MSIDSYKCRSTVSIEKKRDAFDDPSKPPYLLECSVVLFSATKERNSTLKIEPVIINFLFRSST